MPGSAVNNSTRFLPTVEQEVGEFHIDATIMVSLISHHQNILQDVEVLQTVSVVVAFLFRTVVGGFLHLAATLGGNVFVVRSQHEQSLLYVFV